MNKISFITSNPHKFSEMSEFFKADGLSIEWIDRKLPELQADTLEDVVRYSLSQAPEDGVFIEDAGFFIDALGGFPGVYSRYVFDTVGNDGILRLLDGAANRAAWFEAVIGYKNEVGGDIKIFKGEVKGYVSLSPKGGKGFGYDPIFVPQGFDRTFGEDDALKSKVSHRRKAADRLIKYLKSI